MPADTFAVLAEPTRRRILDRLRTSESSVGELVEALAVSQPTMSKHLKVLRQAGLVSCRTAAQRRIYRIETSQFQALDEWLEPYRRVWTQHLRPRASSRQPGGAMNRTTFDPGPLADVDSRPDGERWTLVFVRDLRHSPEMVWAALTVAEHLLDGQPIGPIRGEDAKNYGWEELKDAYAEKLGRL